MAISIAHLKVVITMNHLDVKTRLSYYSRETKVWQRGSDDMEGRVATSLRSQDWEHLNYLQE